MFFFAAMLSILGINSLFLGQGISQLHAHYIPVPRGVVERAFQDDWRFKMLGSRYAIAHQFLEPCNFGPNAHAPKIQIISGVVNALLEQFGKRKYQIEHLEGNY